MFPPPSLPHSLSHLAVQYANKMGYNVVALSSSDAKKELATSLGAHHYISGKPDVQVEALQKMGGAAMIVCTAPSPEIIGEMLPALAVGGTILLLAVSDRDRRGSRQRDGGIERLISPVSLLLCRSLPVLSASTPCL